MRTFCLIADHLIGAPLWLELADYTIGDTNKIVKDYRLYFQDEPLDDFDGIYPKASAY